MQTRALADERMMADAVARRFPRAAAIDRVAVGVAGLLLASGLVHVAILAIAGGSWDGPLSLRKPATFGLSFGLTLLTITWVSHAVAMSGGARARLVAAFAAASVLETALVSLQAWRGVPSHFNVDTTFDAWVTRGLAFGGISLVGMVVWLTVAAFRSGARVPRSQRLAVRAGFLALCGAMAAGAIMIGRGMALVISGAAQTAYATGGQLKPIHAVLMHGILVLPLLAWLMARIDGWSEARRVRLMHAAIAAYVVLIAIVAVATLAG